MKTPKLDNRPSTCGNLDADCHREPVVAVYWAEEYMRDDWREHSVWLCDPCLQAMLRGFGASEEPYFEHYGEFLAALESQ